MIGDYNLEVLKKALDASTMRQSAISDNIANVNTKDYKSKQVIFEEELVKALQSQRSLENIEPYIVEKTTGSLNSNGNNVDLEAEMVNMAKNQLYYNTLVQMTSKKLSVLRHVISEGSR